jgi:hypothetical protein
MNLADEYLLATNWNLATLDELTMLKSSSNYRIGRQRGICETMLHVCQEYEGLLSERAITASRVRKILGIVKERGCSVMDALVSEYPRM